MTAAALDEIERRLRWVDGRERVLDHHEARVTELERELLDAAREAAAGIERGDEPNDARAHAAGVELAALRKDVATGRVVSRSWLARNRVALQAARERARQGLT